MCVCVCSINRERESVCVCVCSINGERERECVCVCVASVSTDVWAGAKRGALFPAR